MKKIVCLLLVLALLGCAAPPVCAEEGAPQVTVTIAKQGALAVTQETVTVTDADNDGALTVSDALYAAHEAAYEGGAAAGYNAFLGTYGLSLGKLWGDESGNFGYYKNDTSCMSLADTVENGDTVYAFVYADTTNYSDTYCYFDTDTVTVEAGNAITLTLSAAAYDANWAPVTLPVGGAVITLNGEATAVVTDAEGKATVVIDAAGTYVIGATSETMTMVPPVCTATVTAIEKDEPPATGETATTMGAAAVLLTLAGAALLLIRKTAYEN